METDRKNWTVISLGGSLIMPDSVAALYVKEFVTVIIDRAAKGECFAIITGGGKICREYQDALKTIGSPTNDDLDLLGIYATRFNAELLRLSFGVLAEPAIFLDPKKLALTGKPILVGGGSKPGHSSDGAAVDLAEMLGAKRLINLSNIDYVYTADPRTNPEAEEIEKISWADFRTLLPKEWNPGINAPFDPIAAEMAEKVGLEVAVMNGKNLDNFANYLDGKEFVGTVIL